MVPATAVTPERAILARVLQTTRPATSDPLPVRELRHRGHDRLDSDGPPTRPAVIARLGHRLASRGAAKPRPACSLLDGACLLRAKPPSGARMTRFTRQGNWRRLRPALGLHMVRLCSARGEFYRISPTYQSPIVSAAASPRRCRNPNREWSEGRATQYQESKDLMRSRNIPSSRRWAGSSRPTGRPSAVSISGSTGRMCARDEPRAVAASARSTGRGLVAIGGYFLERKPLAVGQTMASSTSTRDGYWTIYAARAPFDRDTAI